MQFVSVRKLEGSLAQWSSNLSFNWESNWEPHKSLWGWGITVMQSAGSCSARDIFTYLRQRWPPGRYGEPHRYLHWAPKASEWVKIAIGTHFWFSVMKPEVGSNSNFSSFWDLGNPVEASTELLTHAQRPVLPLSLSAERSWESCGWYPSSHLLRGQRQLLSLADAFRNHCTRPFQKARFRQDLW